MYISLSDNGFPSESRVLYILKSPPFPPFADEPIVFVLNSFNSSVNGDMFILNKSNIT